MPEKEKQLTSEKLPPEFANKEFRKKFLDPHKIQPEDYETISKVINIIKSWDAFGKGDVPGREILLSEFHNFFLFAKEQTQQELEKTKYERYRPENWAEFLDLLSELTKKYNYWVPHQLLRVLMEETNITRFYQDN